MKDKKRLVLTSLLTLIITFVLDILNLISESEFLVLYLLIFLVTNIYLSE